MSRGPASTEGGRHRPILMAPGTPSQRSGLFGLPPAAGAITVDSIAGPATDRTGPGLAVPGVALKELGRDGEKL